MKGETEEQRLFGTVARLNLDVGFGYVLDANKTNQYIFLIGKALSNAEARRLRVGAPVQFLLRDQGRVEELKVL